MNCESHYWKDDLIKQAEVLRKRCCQKRWTEASYARLEQSLMLGFYTVRKLIEAKQLADVTANREVKALAYPATGKAVTFYNWHKLDQLYDLQAGQTVTKSVLFLCNQFIHSYVFMPVFDENGALCSVIVASDREKKRWAYNVHIPMIAELFKQIGEDYPNEIQAQFNEQLGDYDIVVLTHSGSEGPHAPQLSEGAEPVGGLPAAAPDRVEGQRH